MELWGEYCPGAYLWKYADPSLDCPFEKMWSTHLYNAAKNKCSFILSPIVGLWSGLLFSLATFGMGVNQVHFDLLQSSLQNVDNHLWLLRWNIWYEELLEADSSESTLHSIWWYAQSFVVSILPINRPVCYQAQSYRCPVSLARSEFFKLWKSFSRENIPIWKSEHSMTTLAQLHLNWSLPDNTTLIGVCIFARSSGISCRQHSWGYHYLNTSC